MAASPRQRGHVWCKQMLRPPEPAIVAVDPASADPVEIAQVFGAQPDEADGSTSAADSKTADNQTSDEGELFNLYLPR
jgi:hypothetical protein